MFDTFFMGLLIGRCLMTFVIVYLILFAFARFHWQLAWSRLKTTPALVVIALVTSLPILSQIGTQMS